MRDHRSLGRAAIGATFAVVLLTGCAEKQPANETLPSSSAAPTTEALPPMGPVDFPVPDEARTQDAAGAEAFLRYWIDLLNHQRAIPAGQALRDLGPECQNCQRIAQNYEEAAAASNRYEGGDVTIGAVAKPTIHDDTAIISFIARREPVALVNSGGATVDAQPDLADQLSSGITITWSTPVDAWLVTGFDLG